MIVLRKCKVIYAVYVKINMPLMVGLINGIAPMPPDINGYIVVFFRIFSGNLLDREFYTAYIILHTSNPTTHFGHNQLKARTTQNVGSAQPASRTRAGPGISGRHVLRSPRPNPGEVRDVALGPCRRGDQSPGSRPFRDVAPHLLSSRCCFFERRTGGVITPTSGAKRSSQAHHRGDDLDRDASGRTGAGGRTRSGTADRDNAWHDGSSAQHRAGPRTQKKTPEPTALIDLPVNFTETYEALRSQALLGGGCRVGLAAIVHHGMIGGLTRVATHPTLATSRTPLQPTCDEKTIPIISDDPVLVQLMTTMVLRVHCEASHVY